VIVVFFVALINWVAFEFLVAFVVKETTWRLNQF
jgi:hypothetical protein